MSASWEYYKRIANKTNTDEKTDENGVTRIVPNNFSLDFFYSEQEEDGLNDITRAFLDPKNNALPEYEEVITVSEIKEFCQTCRNKPYDAQCEAIAHAINDPVSIIQGPPGTGKTDTIINILRQLYRLYPATDNSNRRTVALVSNNKEAIENIHSVLDNPENDFDVEMNRRIAKLGNQGMRKAWKNRLEEEGHEAAELIGDKPPFMLDAKHLEYFPFFSSTVHSLRKLYNTENFDYQFDYVIVDESSQASITLGIVAMSCARHLVVLGDSKQLSAIISDDVLKASAEFERMGELGAHHRERDEWNFLTACDEAFGKSIHPVFLNGHYRCHPSVIGFCNEFVYNNELDVRTKRASEDEFRMRAVWYEGDYYEKTENPQPTGGKFGYGICNERQIKIFTEEELPRIDKLNAQGKTLSVAVISPFRAQLERLQCELEQLEYEAELKDDDNAAEKLPCLTIHKSQGKGYDIVYLLTVADADDETGIWAQRMRMINVAVSRAKKEFCIITSNRWLPAKIQQELTGYVLPVASAAGDEKNNLFFCKLLRYITEKCPVPQGDYGLHKSKITSVFDEVPKFRQMYGTEKNYQGRSSAPARCVYKLLCDKYGEDYTILAEVPLNSIEQLCGKSIDEELSDFVSSSRLDFVLCKGNEIKLIIEVDGAFHRGGFRRYGGSPQYELDEKKNKIIRDYLNSGDIFIRLSTGGSEGSEAERIDEILSAGSRTVLTLDERTIDKGKAENTINMLLETRDRLIMEQFNELVRVQTDFVDDIAEKEEYNAADFSEEQNNVLKTIAYSAYSGTGNVKYISRLLGAVHHCRYSMAYLYEYSVMFELLLRTCFKTIDENDKFGVFSFGCGAFADAWAMAYARARLAARKNTDYNRFTLYYKGVDSRSTREKFIPPSAYGDMSPEDTALKDLFGNIRFFKNDIDKFVEGNLSGKTCYHNILMFPKCLSGLDDNTFDKFLENLSTVNFDFPEYYICASHSSIGKEKGMRRVSRIVETINHSGKFEVCDDIHELIDKWQFADFRRAMLKNGDLEDSAADGLYKCYKFADEGAKDRNHHEYTEEQVGDFEISEKIINRFDDVTALLRKHTGFGGKYYAGVMKNTKQMNFQIIRLKSK